MKENNQIDHTETPKIVCPHCGHHYEDSWEFPNKEIHECDNCSNSFYHERKLVTESYSTTKALPQYWDDDYKGIARYLTRELDAIRLKSDIDTADKAALTKFYYEVQQHLSEIERRLKVVRNECSSEHNIFIKHNYPNHANNNTTTI